MVGFLTPLVVLLAIPLYLQGVGMLFWMSALVALGFGVFTTRRLIVGPTWYR
jgi:uncharacterized membrane protein YraQ (UPF0718 family)